VGKLSRLERDRGGDSERERERWSGEGDEGKSKGQLSGEEEEQAPQDGWRAAALLFFLPREGRLFF
jgi:hypothetical protein